MPCRPSARHGRDKAAPAPPARRISLSLFVIYSRRAPYFARVHSNLGTEIHRHHPANFRRDATHKIDVMFTE